MMTPLPFVRLRLCSVYLIAAVEKGVVKNRVKIGVADNPLQRLQSLQTGSPTKLTCLGAVVFPSRADALFIERSVHEELKRFRSHGEWSSVHAARAGITLVDAARRFHEVRCVETGDIDFVFEVTGASDLLQWVDEHYRLTSADAHS